jgi:uncharacterized membrane protein
MKKNMVKNYLIAGLLVIAPIWITFLVLGYLLSTFDKVISLLPPDYQPDALFGFHIPGFGLLVVLVVIFFTGMLATNFVGKYVINFWDAILAKIPLVRSIHTGVKQILSTMLIPGGKSFRKVLLIEYPRRGIWTLAFQTGTGFDGINPPKEKNMIMVFVPTTPNPIGGFLLLIPKSDVKELKIGVEDAFKFIISLGAIIPMTKPKRRKF